MAPSGLHIPLANKKISGLFLEGNTNPFEVVSGRAQKIIKEQHSYICAIETLEINLLLAFSLFGFPTLGYVYRNCTADGWSEMYPPYEEACVFSDDSEPESEVYGLVVVIMPVNEG